MHLELVYEKHPDRSLPTLSTPYGLIRYRNSNFTRDLGDKKSVMGYCFFLNDAIVLWSSKKQRTVLILTIKVEYIIIGYVTKEEV